MANTNDEARRGAQNAAVTIRDVAERAGVAVSTASRALGNGSASEATREKVRRAAMELNFVPNAAAKRLPSGRSNVVALVVNEPTTFLFQDDFISGMLGQLSLSLTSRGLLPFLVLASPEDSEGFNDLLMRSGCEGVIVASIHEGRALIDNLKKFDKPAVFVGKPPESFKCPFVDVDNFDGGFQAGHRLLERGCTRLAVIEGPRDMPTPRERTAGFRAALQEAGLEPVATYSGSYEMQNGIASMERIIKEHPEVDGVFAHSDRIAAGVIHVLARNNKRVPEDVAVVGFDDLQVATLLNPQLTTLAQPVADLADAAAEMLHHRLNTGEWKVMSQRFPVRLVVRESA
ncbi:LacI family DNA-binding transcriptional regulator [Bifidobacterium canis]|uniref:Transcriptional regulator n=1 Tax=Bifidobacterium canis TaxID=2610880 RepID=A0A7K1J629_9BIFI|nr:LacI family DNA-binding transcriptional regulator [Bifidobacterium canis]MUH60052.1 transcriptional regulator [Bifidobacterium canis]